MKSTQYLNQLKAMRAGLGNSTRQVVKGGSPGERILGGLFPNRGAWSGDWTQYKYEQVAHLRNWTYCAINTICSKMASIVPNTALVTDQAIPGVTTKAGQRGLLNLSGRGYGGSYLTGGRYVPGSSFSTPKASYVEGSYVGTDHWDPTSPVPDYGTGSGLSFSDGGHSFLTYGEYRSKALSVVKPHEELEPLANNHPLRRLIENPNPVDTSFDLFYELQMFSELCGVDYLWVIPNNWGVPCELWCIPSHWVWPRTGGGKYLDPNDPHAGELVSYYEVRPWGGIGSAGMLKIPPNEIIATRSKSPINKIDGYSKLAAGAQWIDSEESITKSRWAQFQNVARPEFWVELGPGYEDPDDDGIARIEAKFMNKIQGEINYGKPVITPPGAKLTPLSFNPTEMAYFQCLSSDTLCVTKDGPKPYTKLTHETEIACYDPDTKKIVYHKPSKITVSTYTGTMYSWETENVSALMTPNHRTYTASLCFQGDPTTPLEYKTERADEIDPCDIKVVLTPCGNDEVDWVVADMIKEVPYSGIVWCVTVPTGLFVVSRNNKEHITHNSEDQIRDMILSLFQVPKAAVGISNDMTYGSVLAVLANLCSACLNPRLSQRGLTMTKHLAPHWDEKVPAWSSNTGNSGGYSGQAVSKRTRIWWDDCHSEDTLCLTSGGYKPYTELTEDTLIGCYDKGTNSIIYSKPSRIIARHYEGPMYKWEGMAIDTLMTPHHRVYIDLGKGFEVMEAQEVPEGTNFFFKAKVDQVYLRARRARVPYAYGPGEPILREPIPPPHPDGLYDSGIEPKGMSIVNYSGTVWCVTVPTGLFIVRRNNKAHVSGNCVPADPQQVNADLGVDSSVFAITPNEVRALRGRRPYKYGGDDPLVDGPNGLLPLPLNTGPECGIANLIAWMTPPEPGSQPQGPSHAPGGSVGPGGDGGQSGGSAPGGSLAGPTGPLGGPTPEGGAGNLVGGGGEGSTGPVQPAGIAEPNGPPKQLGVRREVRKGSDIRKGRQIKKQWGASWEQVHTLLNRANREERLKGYFHPDYLSDPNGTVVYMGEEGDHGTLPILADWLEEVGNVEGIERFTHPDGTPLLRIPNPGSDKSLSRQVRKSITQDELKALLTRAGRALGIETTLDYSIEGSTFVVFAFTDHDPQIDVGFNPFEKERMALNLLADWLEEVGGIERIRRHLNSDMPRLYIPRSQVKGLGNKPAVTAKALIPVSTRLKEYDNWFSLCGQSNPAVLKLWQAIKDKESDPTTLVEMAEKLELGRLQTEFSERDRSDAEPDKSKVLCHIAGPSGSGKTTLAAKLREDYLGLTVRDLDDFDNAAVALLGWVETPKRDFSDDMLEKLAQKRQELMDDFLADTEGPIVLVGHHWEGEHELQIPTTHRFMLDVDAETSAQRAYERSQHEE